MLAMLLTAWCAPSVASNGLDTNCEDGILFEQVSMPAAPSLASHTEDAVDDPTQEDSAQLSALRAAGAEHSGDKVDETENSAEQLQSNETPAVTTQLPGVSDTAISRFRRQMLRTDI
jgi:hypothetical protein